MPPEQRPRSSSSSKALLTKALLEAQSAVQLDNAYDIPAALDAYRRAVNLLSKVMDTSSSADEQERLRTIVSVFHTTHTCYPVVPRAGQVVYSRI